MPLKRVPLKRVPLKGVPLKGVAATRALLRYNRWASATQSAPPTTRTGGSIFETDRPAPPACFLS
jgi:hypothetical protein